MSKRGNLEEVQRLIKSGVRVDCTDEVRVIVTTFRGGYGLLSLVSHTLIIQRHV